MKNRIIVWFLLLWICTTISIAERIDKKELVFSDAQKEMMMSDTKDSFVMPSEGALANSLTKDLKSVDWSRFISSKFNPTIKLESNIDRAFLLGIKGADAYFLAISKKTSELHDVSKSINFLLNKIRIDNKSINTHKRKNELRELENRILKKEWSKVLRGISKLKDEINHDFEIKNKSSLKLINNIGGWIEGYRLAIEGFKSHYKKDATVTLLQDSLITHLLDEIEKDEGLKNFSKKSEITTLLTDINYIIMGVKNETVSKVEIEALSKILSTTTIL